MRDTFRRYWLRSVHRFGFGKQPRIWLIRCVHGDVS